MEKLRTTFVQQPLDDDADDLFALQTHTCADCGASFQTSRRAARCATCASLRTGPVGAATVVCPVCGLEHQIPILKPHKLCLSCAADMPMTLASARVRFDDAKETADALSTRLDADTAHADEATQARFAAAVQMLITGRWGDKQLTTAQCRAKWDAAIAKGDDLGALLTLYDQAAAAALVQIRAAEAVRVVEEAIEGCAC